MNLFISVSDFSDNPTLYKQTTKLQWPSFTRLSELILEKTGKDISLGYGRNAETVLVKYMHVPCYVRIEKIDVPFVTLSYSVGGDSSAFSPDVLKDLFGKIASGAKQLGRFAIWYNGQKNIPANIFGRWVSHAKHSLSMWTTRMWTQMRSGWSQAFLLECQRRNARLHPDTRKIK